MRIDKITTPPTEKYLNVKISKNLAFPFVFFFPVLFRFLEIRIFRRSVRRIAFRYGFDPMRTLSIRKSRRRKKRCRRGECSRVGGNLDWLATWLSSIRELEQRIKRLGEGERGLVCARDRTKGKRCNGTIRAGLTGKADVRPPAKSLFPGERRVSTLFSFQIKPLPFIPPSSPSVHSFSLPRTRVV